MTPLVALVVRMYVLMAKFAVILVLLSIVIVSGFAEPVALPVQFTKFYPVLGTAVS